MGDCIAKNWKQYLSWIWELSRENELTSFDTFNLLPSITRITLFISFGEENFSNLNTGSLETIELHFFFHNIKGKYEKFNKSQLYLFLEIILTKYSTVTFPFLMKPWNKIFSLPRHFSRERLCNAEWHELTFAGSQISSHLTYWSRTWLYNRFVKVS